MRWLSRFFHRGKQDAQLDSELRFHVEQQTADNIAAGMNAGEARRRALAQFGGLEYIKEETRDARGTQFIETLLQDFRYSLRVMRKSPGFTAVAVLTLALGIGANAAIFSLIDSVMLRSLPVEKPSQLVVLKWSARHAPNTDGYWSSGGCADNLGFGANPSGNPHGCAFSEPLFQRMTGTNAFSALAAFADSGQLDVSGDSAASIIYGQLVSGDFFRALGLKAEVGRLLQTNDDSPSATPVVVLSYAYWQNTFGGSLGAIGRTIELNRVPFRVVGVAESRFRGLSPGSDYDVWLPLADGQRITDPGFWANRQDDARYWWLTIIGRLKNGAALARTQAEVSGIFHNEMLHGSAPIFSGGQTAGGGWNTGKTTTSPSASSAAVDNPEIALVPASAELIGLRARFSNPLYVLMLAVGIILLIACANVAGLMLARAAARRKEIAVRLALGASRARLVRQLLTESVTLSVLGGALGTLLAYWSARAIMSFVSSNQPRPLGFVTAVDMHVLGFSAALSLVAGILFGITPAFRGVRADLTPSLKEAEGDSGSCGQVRGRWFSVGNGLVVAQVMLSMVVLTGAGLLIRTLANLRDVDVGFDPRNILIFRTDPTLSGYKGAQIERLYRDLRGRLSEIPGVQAATYSMVPPLSGRMPVVGFHWPGTPQDQMSEAELLEVGPNFFETLRIPFILGRSFTASDFDLAARNRSAAPTSAPTPVIVNQTFVDKFLENGNPLGKQFGQSPAAGPNDPGDPGHEIIGVVRDTNYKSLRNREATIYSPQSLGVASFELRTGIEPRAILPSVRTIVGQMNSNLPLFGVETESQQIDRLLFQERLVAQLAGFFSFLALVLGCVGLYGLLSYDVSRRSHEIGVRIAMGAQPRDILRMVLGEGAVLTATGIAAGLGVALAMTEFLQSLLFEIKPTDPATFAGAGILLVTVAMVACYIPARRAMRVDPLVSLRHE